MRPILTIAAFLAFLPTNADAFFFIPAIGAAVGAAASAGAAAATTAAAASFTFATASQIAMGVLGAAGTVFQALSAKQQADAEAAQHELNAKLEETAGTQRDTMRREELARTVGAIRAARGGRGMTSPTATAFIDEANEYISSDRTVELLNSRQRAGDYRRSAAQARSRGRASLVTGAGKAGLSLFQTGAYAARKFY